MEKFKLAGGSIMAKELGQIHDVSNLMSGDNV